MRGMKDIRLRMVWIGALPIAVAYRDAAIFVLGLTGMATFDDITVSP
jgi:hypothetical protein